MGWDPVSASSGPVHAGGATSVSVMQMQTSRHGGDRSAAASVVLAVGDKAGAVTAWLPFRSKM